MRETRLRVSGVLDVAKAVPSHASNVELIVQEAGAAFDIAHPRHWVLQATWDRIGQARSHVRMCAPCPTKHPQQAG
jgi:hypothetical protein